jgi:hypothetical protein
MDINMAFMILVVFRAPMDDVAGLALVTERAMFKKSENSGAHVKPLFVQGHLDRMPVRHMLVYGSARVNILLLSMFKKLGHIEGDLKCTNLGLSDFAGDPTEAKGIICRELMVGSKTMPTAFFMGDVKGCYNVLLGRRLDTH